MIVGGYDLHLYCANGTMGDSSRPSSCVVRETYSWEDGSHQFAGPDKRDCMKQARAAGWRFRKGDCVCPACWKRGK